MHPTADSTYEANCAFSGTGMGTVPIVLSVFKAIRPGETPREGRLFATDLGSSPVPPLHTIITNTHSICDPTSLSPHKSQCQIFHPARCAPEPLSLNRDDEGLPEQVIQTGGFGAILYVPSYISRKQPILQAPEHVLFPPGWQTWRITPPRSLPFHTPYPPSSN